MRISCLFSSLLKAILMIFLFPCVIAFLTSIFKFKVLDVCPSILISFNSHSFTFSFAFSFAVKVSSVPSSSKEGSTVEPSDFTQVMVFTSNSRLTFSLVSFLSSVSWSLQANSNEVNKKTERNFFISIPPKLPSSHIFFRKILRCGENKNLVFMIFNHKCRITNLQIIYSYTG